MLASPVIVRELLITARNPLNYRLRLVVGALGTVLLGMAMIGQGGGLNRGQELFNTVHQSAMVMLMIVAPLLTADILSKERREGTLDLLFLTPLTAMRIVVAKFSSQLLRMLTIWAVIVPLSVVPFIAGGVVPLDVAKALLLELAMMILCLTAGIFASALSGRAFPAMLLALMFSGLLLWLDWCLLSTNEWTLPGGAALSVEAILVANLFVVFCASILVLRLAARRISATRQQAGESARQIWFRDIFLTPRYWKKVFQQSMSRKMDTNPLIWLEYRTAWSRGGRWLLVGALILIESYVILIAPMSHWFLQMQTVTGLILLGIVAVTAASSFQREKENGAFELLLVAPFTERSLLSGRLRAVWSYYLPVGVTLLGFIGLALSWGSGYFSSYSRYGNDTLETARLWSVVGSAITVPLVGLFFALRMKHFLPTLAATILTALIGPMFLWYHLTEAVYYFTSRNSDSLLSGLIASLFRPESFPHATASVATHALLAVFFYVKTHELLRARQFA